MNRLITCASVAALGAVALQAQTTEEPAVSKPWSLSAKLRGFYDDNIYTTPTTVLPGTTVGRTSSWGFDVQPKVSLNLLRDVTTLGVSYTYDLRWYEARANNELDQTHMAELNFSHAFSEKFRVDVLDSFAYSDEPSVIAGTTGMQSYYYRSLNNNVRNFGSIALTGNLTEKLGTRVAYANNFYDYENAGPGSLSALLDRDEHLITADIRWLFQPTTTGLIGYQYGLVEHSSSDFLTDPAFYPAGTVIPGANVRNQESHYVFAGLEHKVTQRLNVQARVGAQFANYPDALPGMDDSLIVPYADAALTYEYSEGSRLQLGVKHGLEATDVALPYAGVSANLSTAVTTSQEATSVYAVIMQKITPKLHGMLRGSWQHGTFEGGWSDGKADDFYTVDANLSYEVNRYIGFELGYAYDRLDSDLPYRGFDRNRVYFGLGIKY